MRGSPGVALKAIVRTAEERDDLVSDSIGLRLIDAFMRIDNAALRRKIVMAVQEIAGDDDN